jgi:dihydropyrimidinase
MMVDLVVRGDTVVTPQGVGAYDILISGEKIVALAAKGSLPVPEGARLIDVSGKIVMPGGIDPHVHCKWHLPNPDGTAGLTDPPDVVGKAAVHGGTTTMIDFTRASQGANVRDAIEKREEDWKGHTACDYAQHLMVEGALPLHLPEQIAEAIQAGFPTVKIFTTDITPSRKGRMVDFGDIWEIFQVLAANHRNAHVRQIDPRGTDRVRKHGRSAQHSVRGHFIPPCHAPGGESAGHGALHDARLRRHRRFRDPRCSGARRADLW